MVVVEVESVEKLSGGDVDDEPFLSSRNTLGNGNRKLKFSNGKGGKFAVGCGSQWWFAEDGKTVKIR